MALKLFGSRGSGSDAIEMALRCAQVDYQFVRASRWEADSDMAALLAANPLGQIPTLVLLDGTVLTETAAILISLAWQYPQAGLLPEEAGPRAAALRALVFIAANGYAAVSVSDYPERWTTATSASARAQVRRAARQQLHRSWEILADMLAACPALGQGKPGALAFMAVVVSRWSGTRQHLATARPEFLAWLKQLERHPRLAGVLAGSGAA